MFLSDKFICATEEISTFDKRQRAPLFLKKIDITKSIFKAEITICGLGFYELFLNDKRLTKGRLAPYISNSDDIAFYDNYDITDCLVQGENAFEFLLGNGMQNCFGGFVWDFQKASFQSSPKLAFAIEITYADNCKEVIEADETVLTKPSRITSNDLRLGESYDSTLPDSVYKNALLTSSPKGEKVLSEINPIITRMELKPVKIWHEDNAFIYDFGYNASGVCRMNINASEGQKLTLTFGEILENGRFTVNNLTFDHCRDTYFQRDEYICREGFNEWEPYFTYHGFRYVKAEGISKEQATEALLTFIVFNTDLKQIGEFHCDDEKLNRLNNMSLNSTLSNFHHFPTDCPHREKNGWTADAALSSAHTLLYFICLRKITKLILQ